MAVPEIVTGAIGTYVGLTFDRELLLALAVSIILFWLLIYFVERLS